MANFTSSRTFLDKAIKRAPTMSYTKALSLCHEQVAEAKFLVKLGGVAPVVECLDLGPFKGLFSKAMPLTTNHLHELIQGEFYRVVVQRFCRSLQYVLSHDRYNQLHDSYFEIEFPSKLEWKTTPSDKYYRVVEVRNEPIFINDLGEATPIFGVILGLSRKGVYQKGDYFHIQPRIKSKDGSDLEAESNAVVSFAAPYILSHLSLFTKQQIDILEMLASGWDNKKISKEIKISINTCGVHRHNIRHRLMEDGINLDEVAFSQKLRDMKVI